MSGYYMLDNLQIQGSVINKKTCYIYLLSLLREVKGGKISDIQNNTNESKQVLVTDITVPSLRGTVISVTSTSLDEFVLFCMSEIFSSYDFP